MIREKSEKKDTREREKSKDSNLDTENVKLRLNASFDRASGKAGSDAAASSWPTAEKRRLASKSRHEM